MDNLKVEKGLIYYVGKIYFFFIIMWFRIFFCKKFLVVENLKIFIYEFSFLNMFIFGVNFYFFFVE